MPASSIRPADPFDVIDRDSGDADTLMARQDRTDPPGERPQLPKPGNGDVYIDAARELSRESLAPSQEALDADREAERVAGGDPDIEMAGEGLGADTRRGPDDGRAVDETEHAGSDSIG